MKPIETKITNTIYAKNQPEYLPLPVYREKNGTVTSCWKLSFIERIKILFTGKLRVKVLTFNKPLQPIKLIV